MPNLARMGRNRARKRGSRARWTALERPTHRRMALQCPQGSYAHRQTRRGMCTVARADTSTLPWHGEGELPGRPAANLGPLSPRGMMRRAIGGTHARIRWPWEVRRDPEASTDTLLQSCNPVVPSSHTYRTFALLCSMIFTRADRPPDRHIVGKLSSRRVY